MDQLGIYNLALRHLGLKKVASISGADPSATACTDFFEPCRDDVFREHQWAFANVQATMITSAVDVPLGWDYAYVSPTTNCAAIWLVYNELTYDKKHEQEFEEMYDPASGTKIICTDLDDAYCEYTHVVSDISVWDNKFVMALSHRLAAEIAPFLTGDDAKAANQMTLYTTVLHEVKRLDATKKIKKPSQSCAAVDVRG